MSPTCKMGIICSTSAEDSVRQCSQALSRKCQGHLQGESSEVSGKDRDVQRSGTTCRASQFGSKLDHVRQPLWLFSNDLVKLQGLPANRGPRAERLPQAAPEREGQSPPDTTPLQAARRRNRGLKVREVTCPRSQREWSQADPKPQVLS